jgi:hypothetical protein
MTPREARLRAGVDSAEVVTAGPVSRKACELIGALPRFAGSRAVSPSLAAVVATEIQFVVKNFLARGTALHGLVMLASFSRSLFK